MLVSNEEAWNFCYIMPSPLPPHNIDDIKIFVPNSLQMGWCESPPYFCAATETARDVIYHLLASAHQLPNHKFTETMLSQVDTLHRLHDAAHVTNILEVFVDDFVAGTNAFHLEHLQYFSNAIIDGIHSIFPPSEVSKHTGEDPVSQRKLQIGEGIWAFTKEILGWIIDGANYTIHLCPSKCKKIITLIRRVTHMRACSLFLFQELAGKLQHAAFGIPGGSGLFSPIYCAMHNDPPFVIITKQLKSTLTDWRTIVRHLASNPISVLLLVPNHPNILQHTDACFIGAGGVIGPGLQATPDIV